MWSRQLWRQQSDGLGPFETITVANEDNDEHSVEPNITSNEVNDSPRGCGHHSGHLKNKLSNTVWRTNSATLSEEQTLHLEKNEEGSQTIVHKVGKNKYLQKMVKKSLHSADSYYFVISDFSRLKCSLNKYKISS